MRMRLQETYSIGALFDRTENPRKELLTYWNGTENAPVKRILDAVDKTENVMADVLFATKDGAPRLIISFKDSAAGTASDPDLSLALERTQTGKGPHEYTVFTTNSNYAQAVTKSPLEAYAGVWSVLGEARNRDKWLPAIYHTLQAA